MIHLRLAALGLLGALWSCNWQRDADEQKSAAQVARAIEVLRNAPNEMKAAPLKELGAVPCLGAEVCATRNACRSAYQLHVDSLQLIAAAKDQIGIRENRNAGKLLVSAEQSLTKAEALVMDCLERERLLRHRYKF